MVEEANASRNVDLLLVPRAGLAVQVNGYRDLGLVCFALNRRCACLHGGMRKEERGKKFSGAALLQIREWKLVQAC